MKVEEGRVAEDLLVRMSSMPRSFKKRGDGPGTVVGGRERGNMNGGMHAKCLAGA